MLAVQFRCQYDLYDVGGQSDLQEVKVIQAPGRDPRQLVGVVLGEQRRQRQTELSHVVEEVHVSQAGRLL